jgi:hypothetical protein
MKLMGPDVHAHARLHRLSIGTAIAVFVAMVAMAIGLGRADAAPKIAVLGAATPAAPSCPTNCQAVGKTTGFQVNIAGSKKPFVAPFNGSLVAWSIKTGAPSTKPNAQNNNQSDMDFFTKSFGGTPKAGVAVLKPINKGSGGVYKLKAQSPVEDLSDVLGQTTTFTLSHPLRIRAGQIVALSVPTWAPAFAINQSANTVWAASRPKDKCTNTADILGGTAQTDIGSQRVYGCSYKTARLLYSATVVADPAASTPKQPSKK